MNVLRYNFTSLRFCLLVGRSILCLGHGSLFVIDVVTLVLALIAAVVIVPSMPSIVVVSKYKHILGHRCVIDIVKANYSVELFA